MLLTKRLEELRKGKRFTHQHMASLLGITRQAYGYYESGKRDVDTATLNKLANIFDVSTDFLLGRDDDELTSANEESLQKLINILNKNNLDINDPDTLDMVEKVLGVVVSAHNKK